MIDSGSKIKRSSSASNESVEDGRGSSPHNNLANKNGGGGDDNLDRRSTGVLGSNEMPAKFGQPHKDENKDIADRSDKRKDRVSKTSEERSPAGSDDGGRDEQSLNDR